MTNLKTLFRWHFPSPSHACSAPTATARPGSQWLGQSWYDLPVFKHHFQINTRENCPPIPHRTTPLRPKSACNARVAELPVSFGKFADRNAPDRTRRGTAGRGWHGTRRFASGAGKKCRCARKKLLSCEFRRWPEFFGISFLRSVADCSLERQLKIQLASV